MKALESRHVAGPLIKLAVFGAVTLALTALLAQTLGSLWFGGGIEYRARFSDVTGVLPGDDVRIAGVKVGQVTRVRLIDNSVAELTLRIGEDVPLAASVRATIRYRNLVGQRYIALTEGVSDDALSAGTGPLRPGGVIPLSQTAPALNLTVLFNGFRPLFTGLTPDDVNAFAYEMIQVLQGERGTIASLLRHTASLSTTLADRDEAIGRVITNLNAILSTLDNRREALSETIAQLQRFISGLAADRVAIGDAVSTISELTSATGSLLEEVRPDLAKDIAGLGQLAGILSANGEVIDSTLERLPQQYRALIGTASDGSWFNFFMCGFDGRVVLPGVGSVNPADFSAQSARCAG